MLHPINTGFWIKLELGSPVLDALSAEMLA